MIPVKKTDVPVDVPVEDGWKVTQISYLDDIIVRSQVYIDFQKAGQKPVKEVCINLEDKKFLGRGNDPAPPASAGTVHDISVKVEQALMVRGIKLTP